MFSVLAFIVLHISRIESSPNEHNWLGRLLRGGNDPQENKPPPPSQNNINEYSYQKMIPRSSYTQHNYKPSNSLDSVYYHHQPTTMEYMSRNIDGIDVGNEQGMIQRQKQNRRENNEQEDKKKSSMLYTHSSSREYWSGRDSSHYHTDIEQQQLQNYHEYTGGKMMPSSPKRVAINKHSSSLQHAGCQIPIHDENYNASNTCIFSNRNEWDEPSYYPQQEQGYRNIPLTHQSHYDKENLESYYPSHSLVNGGKLDDGINRTWDGQHVPLETYINGLEPSSSFHRIYQPKYNQYQKHEFEESSLERERNTKQGSNVGEQNDNAKSNNSGIGSWWGSSNKQPSQRATQEEFKNQQLNVDMRGPDYELYANQVQNSKDFHRQNILEIQEQQEMYYRKWQKNQRRLLNENKKIHSISKKQPQSILVDKDEKIFFLHSKLESIWAKQNESCNKIEKKMRDQSRNYVLKFNQMDERISNLELYATAQSNHMKECKANYTSLNNSLIEMKETIREYESKLEGPNVNTDLKPLHDCGDQEKIHEFNDNKNEFDVMINTLHKNN